MTEPTKWHVRPAKTQISLGICPVWSVFAVCMKKYWVLSYPLSTQHRHWSDWVDAQADLSLGLVHMPFCRLCHELAHLFFIYIYCTKTMQVFFGHVFFSVTETDETIKIYKEYSKMDWKRMKQMKQTNGSSHWWSVSFVSFVTKQDETVQTPWSAFVTKQGVT